MSYYYLRIYCFIASLSSQSIRLFSVITVTSSVVSWFWIKISSLVCAIWNELGWVTVQCVKFY